MNGAAWMAGIADTADPHSEAVKDVKAGKKLTHHHNASRASIPHVHNHPQSNATYDALGNARPPVEPRNGARDQQPPDADEIAWGPEHPCYPHLNPHVPVTSLQYESTRIVRIRRDWMIAGDLAPTFSLVYPEILEPCMTEETFRSLVQYINNQLIDAFDPRNLGNWLDATLGLLSGWLWDDLGFTAVKRKLAKLEAYIENWNRTIGATHYVSIISPRRTGYLSLDIQVPKPELGPDVPPTPSLAPTSTSRPGSIRSDYTSTTLSRSQIGGYAPESQPMVPPIPAQYLEAQRAQR